MTGARETQRAMPGATTALVFANMGIAASFMGHLVSMAVVLSGLALLLVAFGRFMQKRSTVQYTEASLLRARWAMRLGIVGLIIGTVIWLLWRTGVLPFIAG